jgi:ferrous iron transport protein B
VLRAGKVIVIVSIFLSALNSFSLSGKTVDNINDSAGLGQPGHYPILKPIGVHGITGRRPSACLPARWRKRSGGRDAEHPLHRRRYPERGFNPQNSLGDELLAALDETWQSLKDTFSLSVLANPIEASKGDGEMATGAMGVMGRNSAAPRRPTAT